MIREGLGLGVLALLPVVGWHLSGDQPLSPRMTAVELCEPDARRLVLTPTNSPYHWQALQAYAACLKFMRETGK